MILSTCLRRTRVSMWYTVFTVWSAALLVASGCETGQYFDADGTMTCRNCTTVVSCPQHAILKECTNSSDAHCKEICEPYEIANAQQSCDLNCDICRSNQGRCNSQQTICECFSGFTGPICDTFIGSTDTTSPPSTTVATTNSPLSGGDEGNRTVLIVSIVLACLAAILLTLGIIIAYYYASYRRHLHSSSHNMSDGSDESAFSSFSTNSRSVLTNGTGNGIHRDSPQQCKADSILPPPKSWNTFNPTIH